DLTLEEIHRFLAQFNESDHWLPFDRIARSFIERDLPRARRYGEAFSLLRQQVRDIRTKAHWTGPRDYTQRPPAMDSVPKTEPPLDSILKQMEAIFTGLYQPGLDLDERQSAEREKLREQYQRFKSSPAPTLGSAQGLLAE